MWYSLFSARVLRLPLTHRRHSASPRLHKPSDRLGKLIIVFSLLLHFLLSLSSGSLPCLTVLRFVNLIQIVVHNSEENSATRQLRVTCSCNKACNPNPFGDFFDGASRAFLAIIRVVWMDGFHVRIGTLIALIYTNGSLQNHNYSVIQFIFVKNSWTFPNHTLDPFNKIFS